MKASQLRKLEKVISYSFKKDHRLITALTHSSVKDEDHPSNERMEFLGDAVLGLVVTEYLYKNYPEMDEGEMTAVKSVVVSSDSLLKIAKEIDLKKYIAVGKGITKKRTIPTSLIANAVEALIGAIYIDSGYRASKKFILTHVESMVGKVMKKRSKASYKSQLQNYAQKMFAATPHYVLISEEGPDHKKTFELSAVVKKKKYPPGKGKTKKIASQSAARIALRILQEEHGKLPRASK